MDRANKREGQPLPRYASQKVKSKPPKPAPASEAAAAVQGAPGAVARFRSALPPARLAWVVLLWIGVAALIASTLREVVRGYSPLPRADYWAEVLWLKNYYAGQWHVSDLWRQHNEHRILFPRLFFLVDWFLFKGTSVFLFVSILCIQAIHAGIFIGEVRGWKAASREVRLSVAAIVAALFFSGIHLENFTWSFQISFVLVFCAASLSIRSLVLYAEKVGKRNAAMGSLAACIGWAAVANYSLANGILIWPVLLLMAAALRLRPRIRVLIGVLTILAGSLYFSDYHLIAGHTNSLLALRQPVQVLGYVCAYLALPFSRINHSVGVGIGFVALIGAAGAVFQLFRHPDLPRLARLSIGVMVFITGGAFLTALGRMSLGPPEVEMRYATPACVFWVCALLIPLTGRGTLRTGFEIGTSPVLAIAITSVVLAILPAHLGESARFKEVAAAVQNAGLALSADVPARDRIRYVYPDPTFDFPLIDVLRSHHLSLFSGKSIRMGEPLQSHYRLVGRDRCLGGWDSVTAVDSPDHTAETAAGWAWDTSANRPPKMVIIADRGGVIRGLAQFNRDREDIAQALRNGRMTSSGWFGFARRLSGLEPYRAYALLSDGVSVCALRSSSEVPRTVYAVFRRGEWQIDSNKSGAWESEDRAFAFGLAGDYPVAGDWDGSGVVRAGVFRNGVWLLDWNNNGRWDEGDRQISFGLPGDRPVVGDWNHTGVTKIGIFRNGTWILDWNGNQKIDSGDRQFNFGLAGDVPVVGDWDGSGKMRIGVFRGGIWYLDINGDFQFDGRHKTISFGTATDQPVIGDWSGFGKLTIGVFRDGQWITDSSGKQQMDPSNHVGSFGLPGDIAVPWNLR